MNDLKTPEIIFKEIMEHDISLEEGISLLIYYLQESEESNTLCEFKEIFNKLSKIYHEILVTASNLLDCSQNPLTRFTIAKVIMIFFAEESEILLQELINKESSVIVLTQLYEFLNSQTNKISKILKTSLIQKYKNVYNINLRESEFLIDLEASQINIVKQLDISIGYFKKFETNDINTFNNTSYYKSVVRDHHIYALNLSRWEFKEIPESIGCLSELQYLNLSNLKLNLLPNSLADLKNLTYLNLNGNKITDIPKWLLKFSSIRNSKNYLDEGVVPSDAEILALIEVFLGEKLEKAQLNDDIIQWETALNYKVNNAGNVIGIYIKKEHINMGILPEQICNFKYLEELELPENSILNIPDCIGNLQTLKYLDLSFNNIRSIPESITKLCNLENLHLSDNDLAELMLMKLRWNKTGQNYLDKGEFDKAIEECKETLKVYPRNKFALFHLGIAHREEGDTKLAKHAYKQFLKIDPLSSVVWSFLSDVYHQDRRYEKSLFAIKKAIDIEPNVALLWSNLGLNYKKLGKYEDAIESYLKSLDIDPNNKYVWRDLAIIYRDKGEVLKAIEADERALEIELNTEDNKT